MSCLILVVAAAVVILSGGEFGAFATEAAAEVSFEEGVEGEAEAEAAQHFPALAVCTAFSAEKECAPAERAADGMGGDVVDECGEDGHAEADDGEPNEDLFTEEEGDDGAVDKEEGGDEGGDEGKAAEAEFGDVAGMTKCMHFGVAG